MTHFVDIINHITSMFGAGIFLHNIKNIITQIWTLTFLRKEVKYELVINIEFMI